jgi:DNA-binding transcriptional LysR family regulator
MELRYLRTLVAVAETGSFRKAARQLGVSQPALTRQVQELEDELGVRVFDRTKRPIRVTESGASMLAIAANVLRELDPDRLRLVTGAAERLRIGVPPWGYAYVPRFIKAFEQQHGHVPLELQRYTAGEVVEQVGSGELDAAFLFVNPSSSIDPARVHLMPLMREPYGLVLPRDHPLACRSALRILDLADEEFILSDLYAFQRTAIEKAMRGSGRQPKVTIQARQELMMSLVEAGLGVGITTPTVARLGKFNVAFVPAAEEFLWVELSLAWSAERRASGALLKLIDFAKVNVSLFATEA